MGAYLSEPVTEKESGRGSGNGLHFGYSSMQGWRTSMEDAHLAIVDLGGECAGMSLFAVFDGHGGREVASFCEEHVADLFKRRVVAAYSKSSRSSTAESVPPLADSPDVWGRALVHTFHSLDEMLRQPEHGRRILEMKKRSAASAGTQDAMGMAQSRLQSAVSSDVQMARQTGRISIDQAKRIAMQMSMLRRLETVNAEPQDPTAAAFNVGCTAVCVVLSSKHIVCANAGDSRAVLCRQAKAVPLSHDHKPNDEGEKNRILSAGGFIKEVSAGEGSQKRTVYRVNGNLNLSRSVGDLAYKTRGDLGPEQQVICSTPDLIVQARTPEDEFLLLGCDGIWEVKDNREACAFVRPRLAKGQDIPEIAEQLLDACLTTDPKKTSGRGADNMSLVVVQLRELAAGRQSPTRRGSCWLGCFGAAEAGE